MANGLKLAVYLKSVILNCTQYTEYAICLIPTGYVGFTNQIAKDVKTRLNWRIPCHVESAYQIPSILNILQGAGKCLPPRILRIRVQIKSNHFNRIILKRFFRPKYLTIQIINNKCENKNKNVKNLWKELLWKLPFYSLLERLLGNALLYIIM